MWSKMEDTKSHSAIWLDNGHCKKKGPHTAGWQLLQSVNNTACLCVINNGPSHPTTYLGDEKEENFSLSTNSTIHWPVTHPFSQENAYSTRKSKTKTTREVVTVVSQSVIWKYGKQQSHSSGEADVNMCLDNRKIPIPSYVGSILLVYWGKCQSAQRQEVLLKSQSRDGWLVSHLTNKSIHLSVNELFNRPVAAKLHISPLYPKTYPLNLWMHSGRRVYHYAALLAIIHPPIRPQWEVCSVHSIREHIKSLFTK